jgi:hypothetical protein
MARKKHAQGHSPWRIRIFVILVAGFCAAAAFPVLFDRNALPETVRENEAVVKLYDTRDRMMLAAQRIIHGVPATPEEAKQQGYPKDDRKKLEKIISKGAQGND